MIFNMKVKKEEKFEVYVEAANETDAANKAVQMVINDEVKTMGGIQYTPQEMRTVKSNEISTAVKQQFNISD